MHLSFQCSKQLWSMFYRQHNNSAMDGAYISSTMWSGLSLPSSTTTLKLLVNPTRNKGHGCSNNSMVRGSSSMTQHPRSRRCMYFLCYLQLSIDILRTGLVPLRMNWSSKPLWLISQPSGTVSGPWDYHMTVKTGCLKVHLHWQPLL